MSENIIIKHSLTFSCCFFLGLFQNSLAAQEYLGFGVHFAPPIRIDNCCNSYLDVKPIVVPAYSFTFRKMWENKKGNKWYYELGMTSMGIGANIRVYFNDTVSVWGKTNMVHAGFPSILFGGGRVFSLGKKTMKHDFSLGLEGSYKIAHTLIYSYPLFELGFSSSDEPLPLFLRLSAGYGRHVKLLRNVPVYLQVYSNLSFQNIIRAPQYIKDLGSGQIEEDGKYRLNNSEIGIKIFANTDVNYNKTKWVNRPVGPKGPRLYRISMEGQIYMPSVTEYYIPQVDSFSLNGVNFSLSTQIGIKSEFPHPKNNNWATILGLGLGVTTITTHLKAIPSFTREGMEIDSPKGSLVGLHLVPIVGLAYKHPIGKAYLQHSFSTSFVTPVTKDNDQIVVIEKLQPGVPPELWTTLLRGEVDNKYGRSTVLFGLEYQPELLFHLDERFFYGIGLVFNISDGDVAHGRVTVDNGRTAYYGAIFQKFSKIGLTARMGWNSSPRN
ncbi:MAG: hypothetical protein IPH04_01590 [Saprospirales bacterium]|nr:hypothetical protein [Saprospirales bacterium]